MAQNCWEFKKCGREPGGSKIEKLGICPATTKETFDGQNNGKNAGRYCWKVAGTLCAGEVQGNWVDKMAKCMACDFFKSVKKEEGSACAL